MVVYEDDVVFDSNFVPLDACPCYDASGTDDYCVWRTNGTKGMRMREWVDKMRQRLGKPMPQKSSAKRVTPGPSTLYKADAWLYYGVATIYSSSGKLIGTGPFEYSLPCVYGPDHFEPLQPNEAGDKKRHTPFDIKTSLHSIKGHHTS